MTDNKIGASYGCPVVLDDAAAQIRRPSSIQRRPSRKRDIITIDEDEEDRKMSAKTSKGPDDDDEVIAAQLQAEEWMEQLADDAGVSLAAAQQQAAMEWNVGDGADASLAASLFSDDQDTSDDVQNDAALAALLQEEEVTGKEDRKKAEDESMRQSVDGRAWLFVNQVLDLQKKLSSSAPGLTAVSVDDMVFLAKQFLQCQEDFQANGSPSNVTIAYHYTRSERMDKIREEGLMTLADRRRQNAAATGVGVFGDGVYTGTNPYAFTGFGDVGLLVAVLLGNTTRVNSGGATSACGINTKIGNKALRGRRDISEAVKFYDELVLQESRQCLPLMRFGTAFISRANDTAPGNDAVWTHHQELQKLIDQFFNGGKETALRQVLPSTAYQQHQPASSMGSQFPLPGPVPVPFGTRRSRRSRSTAASLPFVQNALPVAQPVTAVPAAPMPSFPATQNALPVAQPMTGVPAAPMPQFPGAVAFGSAGVAAASGVPALPPSQPQAIGLSHAARRRQRGASRAHVATGIPASGSWPSSEILTYQAPASLNTPALSGMYDTCAKAPGSDDECPICMDRLCSSGRVVRLKVCGHEYHRNCIDGALKTSRKCPVCRKLLREPQGHSPSGTMSITPSPAACSGFESSQSIVITYVMPSGIQMPYHENPGQRYHGTTRTAYLPDNEDGRKLLKRLKYAWMHGLTFRIGTSLTTRHPNCITWSSVHHKTSPSGGPHGFPDPGFFVNCHEELNSLGVPEA